MSYATLTIQSRDTDLINRVTACVQQEARNNPNVADTGFAAVAIANPAEGGAQLIWPVSIATDDEYASALANGVERPGNDESVITDAMILSAVQADWPQDTPT